MSGRVLVAYATKHHATGEIAEAIGDALRAHGLMTDVVPAHEVGSVDQYGAVVLGSAVYMGRWRKDAMRVLKKNRSALAERDVWLFSSGPVDDPAKELTPEEACKAVKWTRPKKVEALAAEIGAHEHAVFAGRIDESGSVARKGMARALPEEHRDQRDWDMICAWADGIAEKIAG